MRGNHTVIFLCLSPSLPLSLKINKNLKKYILKKVFLFLNSHPRTCLLILERREGRERERKRNIDVREKHQHLPLMCAPTGGRNLQPRYVL